MKVQRLGDIKVQEGKKIYFASDFHFGIPNQEESNLREKRIIAWFDEIKNTASHIFLLGDLFDTWIEYKTVAPKGNIRFLGKLADLVDAGIKIYVFTGNHDLWMYGYFEKELGIPVFHNPIELSINNKIFFLAHGDGLGPGDARYKFLKAFLNNKVCQKFYGIIHPDLGIRIATYFSKKGLGKKYLDQKYQGDDKEYLFQFCKNYKQEKVINYFIFGHRHLMLEKQIGEQTKYINLGDWISYNSYAEFDGIELSLKQKNK